MFRLIKDPQLNHKANILKKKEKITRDNSELGNKKWENKTKQMKRRSYLEWPELCFLEVKNGICARIILLGLLSDVGITYCPWGKP